MPVARLDGRAVIRVGGADAEAFLNNLITTEVTALPPGKAVPGALLSPQGKILFDFLLSRDHANFRLDCPAALVDDFLRRLMMYRLRAKVDLTRQDPGLVHAGWELDMTGPEWLEDSRFPSGVAHRAYGETAIAANATEADWRLLRIRHGVGESGEDFAPGDAFPHDILFDRNGGVSFRKGCFIGQEVVSRMQHRGTARRRLLIVASDAPLPETGTPVTAGGLQIGTLGSVHGGHGLAIIRMDRAARAMTEGTPIEADGRALQLAIPGWAGFDFPLAGDSAAEDA